MNEFPRRLTAERGENRCPSQKGVRMSRNVGPEGKALETVRIPQVPAAVGGGGGVHVGDKAGCADSVYAGETLLPLVNSSAEFRRPCGNVQGPGRKHHGGWNTDGSRENMKRRTSNLKPETISPWCLQIARHLSSRWRYTDKKCTEITLLGPTTKTYQ